MLSFFPRGVLDEILNLIESVSEGFPSYSYTCRQCCTYKTKLRDLWRLETIGIHDTPQDTKKKMLFKQFNETIEYENGRYRVSWPWKEDGRVGRKTLRN